ncbi:Ankyrin repeat domain-containing protein 7 [Merluccius polli]|uniref:Ankyrin repeat domain-containing protein 7 n=1 Tax=Merluccius polli TaxID=89951 RepID=A0AA47NRR1_MERPO|nr:Ankyrin repeat domain-containing protein 7 [Merluccius polli]
MRPQNLNQGWVLDPGDETVHLTAHIPTMRWRLVNAHVQQLRGRVLNLSLPFICVSLIGQTGRAGVRYDLLIGWPRRQDGDACSDPRGAAAAAAEAETRVVTLHRTTRGGRLQLVISHATLCKMKKIFNFTKKKKFPSNTSDNGSTVSGGGYDLKEKDLGKVHKAALLGDVAKLVQLAKKNDINQLDKENRTPLHIACASGHVDVVQFLVESKVKLNLCDNQNRSALMKAVQCQHERCVSVLLEGHADPNLVDINGNTALHLAANIPSSSIATLLLEHEADINAQNKEGFTPLAVTIRENHVEMAEFLLKEGTDLDISDQGQRSPLMIAAGNGQISMLRLLLQHDADISLKDSKGWSADDHAVINGHHACSHLIIEHGTKRNGVPSPSHQVPSRKKKKGLLGSPPHGAEAGFSLGGPAIDKDASKMRRIILSLSQSAGNAQLHCHCVHFGTVLYHADIKPLFKLFRPSVSAADDWPSSDGDDDELDLIPKKQPKLNLKKLIASKKGGNAAQLDRSLSGGESEPESDPRHQRSSSLPKTPRVPQHPVAPFPASFSKTPLKTSTPVQNSSKGGGELGGVGELMSEKASGSKPRSLDSPEGGPDGSPEAGDSEGENEDEEDVDDEEGDDDDDDDDDDEEDDDDNEEEEEEEDEEDEESKEDEEGDDVESEEEEEEEDNSAASALDESNGIEDEHSGAGDLALMVNYSQKECSDNKVTESGLESVEPPDNDKPNLDVESDKEACSTAIPNNGVLGTLDVPGDCVVSAIRVESKFSDEDESMRSAGQNVGPREAHSGDTSWNDSDDDNGDAGNQVAEHGRNTVLSKRSNVSPENAGQEKLDDPPDAKEEQCRSSWGSLLQGEDSDREGVKVDGDPPDQNRPGVEPEVVPQLKSTSPIPNEESLWDSSSPPLSPSKCNSPKFQLDLPTSPTHNKDPNRGWINQSPSGTHLQMMTKIATGAKKKGLASTKEEASQIIDSVAIATLLVGANLASQTEEATHDVSPVVSPESQDEERPNSPLLDGNVELINPKAKERLGNQNYHDDDDNSWDDDENDEDNEVEGPVSPTQSGSKSFPQMKDKEVAVNSPVLKSGQDKDDGHNEDERSRSATPRNPSPMATPERVIHENEKNEEGEYGGDEPPVSMIEGNDSDKDFSPDPEDPGMGTIKGSPKPEEKSQNSDSRASKLRYDFASAMVKVLESGDDSDSTLGECPDEGPGERSDEAHEPRLTSYAPLGGADDVTHENITELEDHDNEEVHNAAESDSNGFSDEELPMTDIDDVDLDSPHELGNRNGESPRFGYTEDLVKQNEELTDDGEDGEEETDDDDDDDEEEEDEEEEEEGLTSENDQAEEDQEEEEEASPASHSESPRNSHAGKSGPCRKGRVTMPASEKNNGEDVFYIPSYLRREESSKVTFLEPWRGVGRPGDSQGVVVSAANDVSDGKALHDEVAPQNEVGLKGQSGSHLSVLNKLQAKTNRKTDLMEELGLGDVDDLEERAGCLASGIDACSFENRSSENFTLDTEVPWGLGTDIQRHLHIDSISSIPAQLTTLANGFHCVPTPDASDWDSTSTASRRTLPGRRVPSPGPHAPFTPAQPQSPDTNPLVPQKFAVSASRTSPPSPLARNPPSLVQPQTQPEPQAQPEPKTQPQPQPQPRARKMLPQKLDSDEESDWDSDNVTSPSPVKSDSQQRPNLPETQAAVRTAGLSVDEPPSDTEEQPRARNAA